MNKEGLIILLKDREKTIKWIICDIDSRCKKDKLRILKYLHASNKRIQKHLLTQNPIQPDRLIFIDLYPLRRIDNKILSRQIKFSDDGDKDYIRDFSCIYRKRNNYFLKAINKLKEHLKLSEIACSLKDKNSNDQFNHESLLQR
jgi:hypothetical protein